MSQKTYLWILKIGSAAALFTVFFVFKGLLFPFITSKQIPFNILIEILTVFWLAFIIKYPEYRPKPNWIGFGLIAFFAALVLSSVFGVDFNLSFWGDVERMLGVFHLLHFLLFYFILITAFREWQDWKLLFITSVLCAVGVSINGLKGMHYSTIGNTAYVSGYLIFNMFFAILLFSRERNEWLRWIYLLALPILFLQFKKADTSGAMVGLGLSLVFAFLMYGVLAWRHISGARGRQISIAMLSLFVLTSSFFAWNFVLDRDNILTRKSPAWQRIVSNVNFEKRTFQTRLISWKAAWKDFKEHPALGVGHGNFALIFDKHFDPTFYDYTRSETYFDRAHNNVVDIASTSGLVGILAYFFIFGAVGFYLVRGYFDRRINLNEFVILSALMVAYFVQNLAVFDSLVTYIGMMIALGFVYWNYEIEEKPWLEKLKDETRGRIFHISRDRRWANEEIYPLAIAGTVIFIIMYQFNILPWKMLTATIDGQRAWASSDIEGTISNYERALSYNTVLDRDSRTSLNRLFAGNAGALRSLDKSRALEIMDYNIELAQVNVAHNERDSMNQMVLAQLFNTVAAMVADNPERFAYYSDQALEAIDRSIAASPGRVPVYFQKAQVQITRGQQEEALETLRYALSLSPSYYDSSCHLARTLVFFGREDEAWEYYDNCIDLGGTSLITQMSEIGKLVNHYLEADDLDKVIALYRQAAALDPGNFKHHISLAQLHKEAGNTEEAMAAAMKAVEIDPSIRAYAEEFIGSLE